MTVTHLRWAGHESVPVITELAAGRHDMAIELPANLHHALFAHLHPGAEPDEPEEVDATGGGHLLERVAEIGGFEPFSELVAAVYEADGTVHVSSPPPRITISFR